MNKKGQAAMEFLMTYGWAILAAIIAIGVLAYFGIFNLSAPSQAQVSAPFYATAWNIDSTTDDIILEVRNNGGETLDIRALSMAVSDPVSTTCVESNSTNGFKVSPGDLRAITIDGTGVGDCLQALAFDSGTDFRAEVTITYLRPGSSVNLTSAGQMTATAA